MVEPLAALGGGSDRGAGPRRRVLREGISERRYRATTVRKQARGGRVSGGRSPASGRPAAAHRYRIVELAGALLLRSAFAGGYRRKAEAPSGLPLHPGRERLDPGAAPACRSVQTVATTRDAGAHPSLSPAARTRELRLSARHATRADCQSRTDRGDRPALLERPIRPAETRCDHRNTARESATADRGPATARLQLRPVRD